MRILIDVDGVMLNTQEALLKRLNNRYGTRYTLENVTHYHWFESVYKKISIHGLNLKITRSGTMKYH